MNSTHFELATINLIMICVLIFGAFGILRIAKTYLES